MQILMANLQITEDEDVTIEIDIEEMLEQFNVIVIKIKIKDQIVDEGKYTKKGEFIRIK